LGSSLLNILDILFVPRKPSLAVVTYVLLAFLAGSFWAPGRTNTPEPAALSVQDLLQSGALTGAEVSYQPSSPNPIHISLQTRQQREFTGTLEDPTVRELVAYLLLHDQNPGNRLQAVDLVSRMDPNPNTELTLISSALSDPNPGIRLQAVRLLQSYPVSPLLLNACQKILLADENEAVRMEAVKILEKQPSTRMIPLLQLASNRESNPFIQTQVENILYELQQGPVDISARK
ncbi:MAG: HEAT repeat domain-containing protein, partial [Candidatus Neomarinimicrobiota bacterium]